jgi:hypothetical protein
MSPQPLVSSVFPSCIDAVFRIARARAARAIVVALGLAVLFAQLHGHAQVPDALPYSEGYLITGNYVVGGIDLQGQNTTGTIHMSGVPADADILAAYLYWETIADDGAAPTTPTFRGSPLTVVKASSQPLVGSTAACWSSSGTPVTATMYRADVRRLLPVRRDAQGQPTGKRLVNDADLIADGDALSTVAFPAAGAGNNASETAGASLLVVYRDSSEPLRKIDVYDGLYIQPPGATMLEHLQGFYRSDAVRSARITHIVSSGAKNSTEQLWFNGSLVATNPFPDPLTAASDRAWADPTYDVSALMPGTDSHDGYGETAVTSVDHLKTSPYECLSWAAVVFSTSVADIDHDSLPDGLEDTPGGLADPNGEVVDLNGMGASSGHKDIFVEMNAMRAPAGTTYGSADAPINATTSQVTDPVGHNHMPTPEVLKLVGDAFRNAPVRNPDGSTGIVPHFDVGDPAAYHQLGAAYASTDADAYLVPAPFARGGELIQEAACDPATDATCDFPDYPGTVGWKIGFQHYRDEPVGSAGEQLTPVEEQACATSLTCRRRFDRDRTGLFHYVLYAHARGKPKTRFPCLDAGGQPTVFGSGNTCTIAANPDFRVPSSSSGVADLPGGNVMITLGLWDNFLGSPFVQASTTLHELGHNLGLWHGGGPAVWGNPTTATAFQPNCKPNYLSVMSYLFQVHGLLDDQGHPHVDFSRDVYGDVDETFLSDGSLATPLAYRTAWFAPLAPGTLGYTLGTPAATTFCSGAAFPDPLPAGWVPMGRIEGPSVSASVDWNTDGVLTSGYAQDVNFDGVLNGAVPAPGTPPLHGFDDWANIRLDQVGGGRNAGGFSLGVDDFVSGVDDFASGIDDFASGVDDFASGVDDFASGVDDFASGIDDFVSGVDDFASGAELDLDTANALGRTPPNALTACVIGVDCPGAATPLHRVRLSWTAPNVGQVAQYRVYRVRGGAVTAASTPVLAGTTTATTFVDSEELPDGVQFTYFVKAVFVDGTASGASSFATITAVDDPPGAVPDGYATTKSTLAVAAPGVLANDTDDDSPASSLRAVLVTAPANGSLTLDADGSFTYTPNQGFHGTDTFSYEANDGVWSGDPSVPMSRDSNVVTVTITVTTH